MTIRQLRTDAGLSQAKLAAAAGINLRQLQKIEAGEIKLPNITLANALRLAKALNTTVEDLAAASGDQA